VIESGNSSDSSAVVLVVDDNPENRLLLSSQLSMEGHKIVQAGGGHEGIEMAKRYDPDIILLDVMMPDMNGFEVCKHLKEDLETHLIPIIMVTALREVQYRIEGKKVGADEFLSRPHVREELLVRVRTLVQLKRARVRLEEERNRLRLLYDISRAINTQLDLEPMMAEIITQTQAAVGATKGNVMLLDEEGAVKSKFLIRAGAELEISDRVAREVMSRGLGGWLVEHNRGDIIENIGKDRRWFTLPDDREETGSAIGVPLSSPDRIVGVLILNHPETGYFTPEHLALLEAIAGAVTAAIKNAYFFTAINEERRKLEAILAQSTDAIITTDEQWHISLFNQAAERLFDLRADDVVSRPIGDIAQLHILVNIFASAGGQPSTQEVNLQNGRTLYASVSPIQAVGYAAVMQDITELKRIEEMKLEQERREKQQVKETFSRYMGPSLVEHVLSHEPGLMARRERRHAVVMFADIRDFTRFTRMVEPNEVVERLNKLFTEMTEIVYEYEGAIFELTGDEILVGFNAPFDQPDASIRALQTAVAMQTKFNLLRRELNQGVRTGVGLGIGIDQGEVVLGNVGAETRMTFRMVGDAVNTAHRLVDIAVDGQIVVSASVYEDIKKREAAQLEEIKLQLMGPISIKGKDAPEVLYHVRIPADL